MHMPMSALEQQMRRFNPLHKELKRRVVVCYFLGGVPFSLLSLIGGGGGGGGGGVTGVLLVGLSGFIA